MHPSVKTGSTLRRDAGRAHKMPLVERFFEKFLVMTQIFLGKGTGIA
jgi:hypothetical protein